MAISYPASVQLGYNQDARDAVSGVITVVSAGEVVISVGTNYAYPSGKFASIDGDMQVLERNIKENFGGTDWSVDTVFQLTAGGTTQNVIVDTVADAASINILFAAGDVVDLGSQFVFETIKQIRQVMRETYASS
jgi:hypothetical protein